MKAYPHLHTNNNVLQWLIVRMTYVIRSRSRTQTCEATGRKPQDKTPTRVRDRLELTIHGHVSESRPPIRDEHIPPFIDLNGDWTDPTPDASKTECEEQDDTCVLYESDEGRKTLSCNFGNLPSRQKVSIQGNAHKALFRAIYFYH